MTSVAVLVNPAAGGGRAATIADRAVARLAGHGLDVKQLAGRDAADARALAREVADSADVLAVVGGDGMISIALQALADRAGRTDRADRGGHVGSGDSTGRAAVALGIIPAGSGNDHARAYGIPRRSPDAAADVIAAGHTTTVDVGRIVAADGASCYFGTVVAAGFDSLVNDRANRLRWPRGRMRYNVAAVAEIANLRPIRFRVELDAADTDDTDDTGAVDDDRDHHDSDRDKRDAERFTQDLLLVAVGNTTSYGGGMRICPDADPADGLLDVTVVRAMSRLRVLRFFPSVYSGGHIRRPEVETHRAASVRLDAPGIRAYVDGEPVGPLPVQISIVPHAVRILTPNSPAP